MSNYLILTLLLFTFISCNEQSSRHNDSEQNVVNSNMLKKSNDENNGIIYFSVDNGNTWKNASAGLPQKVRIGLGGVAVSEQLLGVATKEYGVYIYHFNDSTWVNVPTEQQIMDGNIGSLAFYKNTIYIGTQHKGIFYSQDNGKTWATQNTGINDLTIRRFIEYNNRLYVCTNDGFYALNEKTSSWKSDYRNNSLQVNGATVFKGSFYIATSKGVYKKEKENDWSAVLPNHSVHNISSDSTQLYAMTYNELLLSSNDGINWQSAQDGLPKELYTFNVLHHNDVVFAGQWDGVYRKTNSDTQWKRSSNGLPADFAATNLKAYNGILVITTSERKLKAGMTTEK